VNGGARRSYPFPVGTSVRPSHEVWMGDAPYLLHGCTLHCPDGLCRTGVGIRIRRSEWRTDRPLPPIASRCPRVLPDVPSRPCASYSETSRTSTCNATTAGSRGAYRTHSPQATVPAPSKPPIDGAPEDGGVSFTRVLVCRIGVVHLAGYSSSRSRLAHRRKPSCGAAKYLGSFA
jgi:hypothetical protein